MCLVKDKIYTRGQREETSYQVQDTYQNLTEQVAKTLKKNTIEQKEVFNGANTEKMFKFDFFFSNYSDTV